MPRNRNRNEISSNINDVSVPKPAKGTPWVNQIIAKGMIERNETADKNAPNKVINFNGL